MFWLGFIVRAAITDSGGDSSFAISVFISAGTAVFEFTARV
jgi:hypothetical protein